jgi:hypothetical protein
MAYLVLNTKQAADDRSRQAWTSFLGRTKRVQDITEFLWERTKPVMKVSVALVIPPSDTSRLTTQERNKLTEVLDPQIWPTISTLP